MPEDISAQVESISKKLSLPSEEVQILKALYEGKDIQEGLDKMHDNGTLSKFLMHAQAVTEVVGIEAPFLGVHSSNVIATVVAHTYGIEAVNKFSKACKKQGFTFGYAVSRVYLNLATSRPSWLLTTLSELGLAYLIVTLLWAVMSWLT